jgi:hypothetical protein
MNTPLLIKDIKLIGLVQNWKNEVTDSINFKYLTETFGDESISVSDCNVRNFSCMQREKMKFSEFIESFNSSSDSLLYLKDWHLKKLYPDLYQVPEEFQDDWLNLYFDAKKDDDYKFVYFGKKGTWTSLHADVFRSYSWSTNIVGKKIWYFYPPSNEKFLRNSAGDYVYDVRENPSLDEFPEFLKAERLEIIQHSGETIFVPSNWFHQVVNLEDTISVNQNWCNASNISVVTDYFLECVDLCRKHIIHLLFDDSLPKMSKQEWDEELDKILKAHHGMSSVEFIDFLTFIYNYLKINNRLLELEVVSNGLKKVLKKMCESNIY